MSKKTIEEMQGALSLAGGFMSQSIEKFVTAGQVVGERLEREIEENEKMRIIISEIVRCHEEAIHWEDLSDGIKEAKNFLDISN